MSHLSFSAPDFGLIWLFYLQVFENPMNSRTNGDIDTESYLKETENIVVALQNRLHSDVKQFDEPEKESPSSKYSNTRLNRAFR